VTGSGIRTPRIVLAWLGLAATLAGIGLATGWPLLVLIEGRARVGDLEARLATLSRGRPDLPALDKALGALRQRAEAMPATAEPDPAAAASAWSARLQGVLGGLGVGGMAQHPLPAEMQPGGAVLALDLDGTIASPQISTLLQRLEADDPLTRIERLEIRRLDGGAVSLSLHVTTLWVEPQ
jgi:hypothetical protein